MTNLVKPPAKIVAHELVARTAEEMAAAVFEEAMRLDNQLYRDFRSQHPGKSTSFLQRAYVKYAAPLMISSARATLAKMLRTTNDEDTKKLIYDALLKDASLTLGREEAQRKWLQ